jgi:FKBP-type peptidyl-prolyl cis-trans isomerase FkpA
LYYIINEPGTGKQPGNSNVTVAYKGYLLMERFFDQSSEAGISFGLQQVIKRTENSLFQRRRKRCFVNSIFIRLWQQHKRTNSGGSVLVFDIKLIKVN